MPTTDPSNLHPPQTRDALIRAGLVGDHATIDAITDDLVEQGLCRPRDDVSRWHEWLLKRPVDAKPIAGAESAIAEAAVEDIGAQLAAHFRGVLAGAAR